MRTLRNVGLVGEKLFKVEGDLVNNYNRVLEKVTEKKTGLTSFSIDKRGISPEIEEELGRNYLQCGPANRYMVIVSPDQKDAELLDEEFSFDNALFDFLYEQYLPGISTVTRIDGLYGRINTGVSTYEALDDMLLLHGASIDLHTPSKFIHYAKELQLLVKRLESKPNLLVAKDSEVPKKILELVKLVGDIRGYNIGDLTAYHEVGTFCTRLFDGVHVFRETEHHAIRKKMKRPNGESANGSSDDFLHSPPRATVIYNDKTNEKPQSGPLVDFIPINSTDKVVDFLVDKGYAKFSEELIQPRLARLEDLGLLKLGYFVHNISNEQRTRILNEEKQKVRTHEWVELNDIQKASVKGYNFESLVDKASPVIRAILLEPATADQYHVPVVANLLTGLWPWDLRAMYKHNRGDLEILFDSADEKMQDYIAHVLKR